uniref:Variant surface glycoprotein 1125.196 n=1 Tax=Trypanosoma brucei TaxID=5691 RepID=A0A1J0R5F6_9TRYP|nr:variant surface glycoprotein 1125.196 [Trypanosoma brucei]
MQHPKQADSSMSARKRPPFTATKAVLATVVALSAALQTTKAQGSTQEDYNSAATTACHELEFLEKVAEAADSADHKARTQVSQLASDIALLTASACGLTDSAAQKQVQALLTLTMRKLNEAKAIEDSAKSAVQGAIILRARAAQTRLLLHGDNHNAEVTYSAPSSRPATTIGSSQSPKYCAFKVTLPTAVFTACPADADRTNKIAKAAANLHELSGLRLLKDTSFGGKSVTGVALKAGDLGSDHQNFATGVCGANTAARDSNTNNALGVATVKAEATDLTLTTHQISETGEANKPPKAATGDEYTTKKHQITNAIVARAVCAIRDTKIQTVKGYLDQDISNLLTDPDVQQVAELLLNGHVKKDGDEQHKKDAVKKLFGTDSGIIQAKIIDPLSEKQITYQIEGVSGQKTVKEAATQSDGHRALASCYGRKHSTQTKKHELATAATTTKKCKEDTDKDKCEADKDCEHSDGKCKLKEGVKIENIGKTTNTTASSNSFVIHKALLWLDFLILA